MKTALPEKLEQGRVRDGYYGSDRTLGAYGVFIVRGPCGCDLKIVSSGGEEDGWEHASVSTERRPPNWQEMCFVKDLLWEPEDCVVQFHPPKSEYINNHPHCLHLWRPKNVSLPLPPSLLVGIKGVNPELAKALWKV